MKITIELNGVKVQKNIPINWSQVTFKEFLELAKAGNDRAKVLSVFTGIDHETLRKAKIHNFNHVNNLISFVEREQINVSKIPDVVAGYAMPKNLEVETIGQYEDMRSEASEMKDVSSYAMICAIYATNPYDYEEAKKKAEDFMKAPCEEVLAIGNFTLMKLMPSIVSGKLKGLIQPSPMRKLKLALIAWISRLVFTVRFYLWKRKLRLTERNY